MFKTVKQNVELPVNDVLPHPSLGTPHRHSALFPNTLRCIIVGPSNCGKTTLLINMLQHPNGLRFRSLYIYSKTLNQPAYQFLEQVLHAIPDIDYEFFSQHDMVLPPQNIKPYSIFIFDVLCQKDGIVKNYFSMGRHYGIDVIYLCQTYSFIQKQLVRDNANFLILFKQDATNLKHIFQDHVSPDFSFEHFQELCLFCWQSKKHGYLVIDKDSSINAGRYRNGLDSFVVMSHHP